MQKVIVSRPSVPAGVEPGGMYVTLSKLEVKKVDEVIIEQTTRQWELFIENWNR
jgi:hypothetical protein